MNRAFLRFVAFSTLAVPTFAAGGTAWAQDDASPPHVSIALERVGGINYSKAYAKDTDDAAALTAFGIGGVNVNPYTAPRLGIDAILDSGLTLGGAISIGRYSLSQTGTSTSTTVNANGATSTTTSTSTQDVGSLFIYTLTPRVGYRIPLSPQLDITPRGGVTLAGGSASPGSGSGSVGVFAMALSGEGVLAYRATKSFNLLAGAGIDYTVTASASQSSGNGSSTTSSDLKGGLYSLQLWLGVGGYL